MINKSEHAVSECRICSCQFSDREGGVQGYFGMIPVAFCPTCYSSMVDMVSQDLEMETEYV